MSRQREWQKRNKAKGLCVICAKKAMKCKRDPSKTSHWCTKHYNNRKTYERERYRDSKNQRAVSNGT